MRFNLLALPLLSLFLFIPIVIAVLVYNDAAKRGMNAIFWALVAALVPGFTGLIIYLIVRATPGKRCMNCGKQIGNDFKVCPYCVHDLNIRCGGCGRETAADWKICPHCGNEL